MRLDVHLLAETADEVKEIALLLGGLTGTAKSVVIETPKKGKTKEPPAEAADTSVEKPPVKEETPETEEKTEDAGIPIGDIRKLAAEKINASTKDAIRAKLKYFGCTNIDSLADKSAADRQEFCDFISAI